MKKMFIALMFICTTALMAFATPDGATLYSKCKACHGADGGKSPAGTQISLKGKSADEIQKMLIGYKEGTFGADKKATMERLVKPLSNDDITALSKYISGL
jgi:cytochrome c